MSGAARMVSRRSDEPETRSPQARRQRATSKELKLPMKLQGVQNGSPEVMTEQNAWRGASMALQNEDYMQASPEFGRKAKGGRVEMQNVSKLKVEGEVGLKSHGWAPCGMDDIDGKKASSADVDDPIIAEVVLESSAPKTQLILSKLKLLSGDEDSASLVPTLLKLLEDERKRSALAESKLEDAMAQLKVQELQAATADAKLASAEESVHRLEREAERWGALATGGGMQQVQDVRLHSAPSQ
eukprot:CAMPEP_0119298408 /NCGR_PEP_ID=MMETSP1333-20130426/603_1 /TAXON_ID=418940 /ORGANISM="Scyphosphaera apsteinii, Strain RCC1455" /LENGTH=241 /DNA_ID=CAMNT_0007299507 /DNA_START=40 /DNA_END=765 /DNA_ORIENTATION=-